MSAKHEFLMRGAKIGKSIIDVYAIYKAGDGSPILHGAVQMIPETFVRGGISPNIEGKYTEISVSFEWIKREGGISSDMTPQYGSPYGPKGYVKWFTQYPSTAIHLSSDVNRQLRRSKRNNNQPWWNKIPIEEQFSLLKELE